MAQVRRTLGDHWPQVYKAPGYYYWSVLIALQFPIGLIALETWLPEEGLPRLTFWEYSKGLWFLWVFGLAMAAWMAYFIWAPKVTLYEDKMVMRWAWKRPFVVPFNAIQTARRDAALGRLHAAQLAWRIGLMDGRRFKMHMSSIPARFRRRILEQLRMARPDVWAALAGDEYRANELPGVVPVLE